MVRAAGLKCVAVDDGTTGICRGVEGSPSLNPGCNAAPARPGSNRESLFKACAALPGAIGFTGSMTSRLLGTLLRLPST